MTEPAFSFVVTTFDRPGCLLEALRSIQQQTTPDWECIVVDDCSPKTPTLPDDPRFRLVRRETNGGPGAARNSGIEAAQGRTLVFLDDDDLVTPERLEIAEEGLMASPIALCWGGVIGRTSVRRESLSGDVSQSILQDMTPHVGQVAIRANATPRFDERYRGCEDVEWWLRLAQEAPVTTVSRIGWMWRPPSVPRHSTTRHDRINGRRLLLSEYADYFQSNRRARAFQLRRLGMQLREVGDAAESRRVLLQALVLVPSLRTARQFLRKPDLTQ